MSIETIKQQTKDLIDRLKSTTNNIGLGNSGNEYTVIVEKSSIEATRSQRRTTI